MNKYSYKNLTPFKWFVLENFPFIEADFDALTDWQLYCKLGKEINKIIESQNVVGTQMENVTNAFIELQNYVNDYFKNLDVQDEINNKLNEMAEDGTLQEIIADYLNSKAIFGYDNVASMKNATNLINGSYARTLGYYSKNDGGGATYKITSEKSETDYQEELENGLYANLIIENNILNAKQIGAKGNNVNDDSSIIQNAINLAISNKYELLIDENTYLINTGLVINDTIHLDIKGELHTTENITILTITSNNSIFNINKLSGTNNIGCGLKLLGRNAYNSINIIEISDLYYGIMFDNQTGGGINYNKTTFIYLDNTYDIYYICDSKAWINQNQFYGGRLSGDYGVYFKKGTNQSNDYDGNNFYDIGFEELYDAITLNFANKNTFKNFRMMEGIRHKYIVLANDCRSNVFESILTSECTIDKIDDSNNTYAKCNIYKMRVSNAGYTISSEDMKIYKGLPIINKFSGDNTNQGDKFWLDVDGTFYTSTNPFSKVNIFMCDLSGSSKTVNLVLDERYDLVNESYNEFYLEVTQRAGTNNLIIKTSDNTELFNLATFGSEKGVYTGLYHFKHVSNAGSSYKWLIYKLQ